MKALAAQPQRPEVVVRIQRHVVAPDRRVGLSLPPDAIAEGVRRLGWLALVYSLGIIAGPFARLVLSAIEGSADSSEFGIPDTFGLGAVIMAIAVFVAVRRGILSSQRLLDLGLVFQVVGALGIAVREFWHGLPQTAVASLLAASMGPAGLAISAAATGTIYSTTTNTC